MNMSRCTVRGSINSDEYFYVRHIARPGETISSKRYENRVGGKGANQAVAITRAGGAADFNGTIGKDGLWLKERMESYDVNPRGIIVSEDPTGRALIQVADDGENSIILFPGANHSFLHELCLAEGSHEDYVQTSHILLQNEIHFESTLLALSISQNMTTIFNPSPLPSTSEISRIPWSNVDWLIVNEGEAKELYSLLTDDSISLAATSREVLSLLATEPRLSNTNIICTLGAEGVLASTFTPMLRLTASSTSERQPSIYLPSAKLQSKVLDTTGAGDCFTGYFVAGLMEIGHNAEVGQGITEQALVAILQTCVHAAAMCVERQGTIDSIPTKVEVAARMASS